MLVQQTVVVNGTQSYADTQIDAHAPRSKSSLSEDVLRQTERLLGALMAL